LKAFNAKTGWRKERKGGGIMRTGKHKTFFLLYFPPISDLLGLSMTCPYKLQIMTKITDLFAYVTWSIMVSIFLHGIEVPMLSLFKDSEAGLS
jgi:hypothetical protein